jgi:putative membrane protein
LGGWGANAENLQPINTDFNYLCKRSIIAAAVIGLVNAIIRPVLSLLTLPITLLTLGLFSFVLNALILWLASAFSPGFEINGFIPALIGSLVLSVVSGLLNWILGIDR